MSVAFEKVQAGDQLWDCRYERAGHTTMRRWSTWPVFVKEINHAEGWALVSWNHNPVRRVYRSYFKTAAISRSQRAEPGTKRRATPPGGGAGGSE